MDAFHVKASWGKPSEVNRTTTAFGKSEQWCYLRNKKWSFVYFDDGIVSAIQD